MSTKPLLSLKDLQVHSTKGTSKSTNIPSGRLSLKDLQVSTSKNNTKSIINSPTSVKFDDKLIYIINSYKNDKIYDGLQTIIRRMSKQAINRSITLKLSPKGKKRSVFKKAFNQSLIHKPNNLLSTLINICRTTSEVKSEINDFINNKISDLSNITKQYCNNLDLLEKLYKSIISDSKFDSIRDEPIYLYSGRKYIPIDLHETRFINIGWSSTINPNYTSAINTNETLVIIKCKLSDGILPILKLCRNMSTKKYGANDAFFNEEEIYLPPKLKIRVDEEINFDSSMKIVELQNQGNLAETKLFIYTWHSKIKHKLKLLLQLMNKTRFNYKNNTTILFSLLYKFFQRNNPSFIIINNYETSEMSEYYVVGLIIM